MNIFSRVLAVGTIAITGYTAQAAAATIDFEAFAPGTDITGMDIGGVILTAGTDTVTVTGSNPAGTGNAIQTTPFVSADPFRADFTVAGVSSVSVALGDFNADADTLFLSAFDSSDTLLDMATLPIAGSVSDLLILSVASGTEISYALFGTIAGAFTHSIFADDLTFDTSVVPLPAALPLFAGGLGLMGLLSRRKKQAATT